METSQNLRVYVVKKNKVKLLNPPKVLDLLHLQKEMWDSGVVSRINPGYGSVADGTEFYIAICDDCLVDLKIEGYIANIDIIRFKLRKYDV